jgi:hypothetical protein
MKKLVVAAALAAAVGVPAEAGAAAQCYSPQVIEAELAVRYLVDLMVASTTCRDQTYGLFQQRNKESVLAYQKVMISHLHGKGAYDKWDTSLANQAALKQAGKTPPQACQEAAALLKSAGAMDNRGFRAYAASQASAAAASGRYQKCGR